MKNHILQKSLALGVVLFFILLSIVPLNGTVVEEIHTDVRKIKCTKKFFNVEPLFDGNKTLSGNPPTVEILYPQDGSIIYTRYSNISVKYLDDTRLTAFDLEYGRKGYSSGYGGGIHPSCKIYYLNRTMARIKAGYVWIVVKAYDEDGNIGVDTAVFYYNDSDDPDLFLPEISFLDPFYTILFDTIV